MLHETIVARMKVWGTNLPVYEDGTIPWRDLEVLFGDNYQSFTQCMVGKTTGVNGPYNWDLTEYLMYRCGWWKGQPFRGAPKP